mmetsp:Transcript_7831/g.10147  ORF Transcript_7831/g.10147 Transcript_7831/m.10147 type:complete len:172 (+) Transcript_7831:37-552(+)
MFFEHRGPLKVIFLDIDGVLSNSRAVLYDFEPEIDFLFDDMINQTLPLEKRCVDLLMELIHQTGAKIVLSSTWREHETELTYLRRVFGDNILGKTKSLSDRGTEIKDWIETYEINAFIIFEDSDVHHESIMRAGLGSHLIKTVIQSENHNDEGLTRDKCQIAKEILCSEEN